MANDHYMLLRSLATAIFVGGKAGKLQFGRLKVFCLLVCRRYFTIAKLIFQVLPKCSYLSVTTTVRYVSSLQKCRIQETC